MRDGAWVMPTATGKKSYMPPAIHAQVQIELLLHTRVKLDLYPPMVHTTTYAVDSTVIYEVQKAL